MVDGIHFVNPLLLGPGICRFLLRLKDITFGSHSAVEHIPCSFQIAVGKYNLLPRLLALLLVISHFAAMDNGEYISFLYIVAHLDIHLRDISSEDGIDTRQLFRIETDTPIQQQLIAQGHLMHSLDRNHFLQTVGQHQRCRRFLLPACFPTAPYQ